MYGCNRDLFNASTRQSFCKRGGVHVWGERSEPQRTHTARTEHCSLAFRLQQALIVRAKQRLQVVDYFHRVAAVHDMLHHEQRGFV